MSKIIQKILILLALPMVGALVVYQIDSELLDPSSERSLFSIFFTIDKARDMSGQINLSGSNSPSQLLNLIWSTFSISDSLFLSTKQGERDPMKPLIALGAAAQLTIRKTIKPKIPVRFPLKNADLGAVFWNPRSPQVFIKGKRYRVGDQVKGATIKRINKTSVEFTWRNKSFTLEKSRTKINVR